MRYFLSFCLCFAAIVHGQSTAITWNLGKDFSYMKYGCLACDRDACRACNNGLDGCFGSCYTENGDSCNYTEVWAYAFSEEKYSEGLGPSMLQPRYLNKKSIQRFGSTKAVRLNHKQIAELISIMNAPYQDVHSEPKLCIFAPHHAYIFYDKKGNVKCWIAICLICDEIMIEPGVSYSGMDDVKFSNLVAFLGELKLLQDR